MIIKSKNQNNMRTAKSQNLLEYRYMLPQNMKTKIPKC